MIVDDFVFERLRCRDAVHGTDKLANPFFRFLQDLLRGTSDAWFSGWNPLSTSRGIHLTGGTNSSGVSKAADFASSTPCPAVCRVPKEDIRDSEAHLPTR